MSTSIGSADYSTIDPADRLSWAAGDVAQCDLWFPPRKILLEVGSRTLLPVLVMTAAHSRFMFARMIPTRKTFDLLLGSWELLTQLGRVPRRLSAGESLIPVASPHGR